MLAKFGDNVFPVHTLYIAMAGEGTKMRSWPFYRRYANRE